MKPLQGPYKVLIKPLFEGVVTSRQLSQCVRVHWRGWLDAAAAEMTENRALLRWLASQWWRLFFSVVPRPMGLDLHIFPMKKQSFFLGIAIGLLKRNENHPFFLKDKRCFDAKTETTTLAIISAMQTSSSRAPVVLPRRFTHFSLLKIKLFLKKTHFSP